MGHDIDIIDIKTGEVVMSTYITGNFSKYKDEYPGIHAIHGHKNNTVIKILTNTLNKLVNDGILPYAHNYNGPVRALTYGDKDPKLDKECYAACLKIFLELAIDLNIKYPDDELYWYSDQVWGITKFKTETTNGYESDGIERPKYESDSDSDCSCD